MRKIAIAIMLALSLTATAKSQVYSSTVKTLQVVVNQEWLSPPVMKLKSGDVLNVDFDELSHTFHRFIYRLEHCEADWSPSNDLFETDWLEGFNDNPIEDYENSLNTTVLYTHYSLQIPNERCRIKMSGNYKLHIIDEDDDGREVICVELRVVEPLTSVTIGVTTNTDIDLNQSHQQVTMAVAYNSLRVTNAAEQIQTFVMQNGREDNMKQNVRPNSFTPSGLLWEHNRGLIFEGGNEYRKFEILDPSHPTLGLDAMNWDETTRTFHATPFCAQPRRNYTYDEDANGAFLIRNSDNTEIDITSDYVYVHYKLMPARHYSDARVMVSGRWAIETPETYVMDYDDSDQSYHAVIMQKLGYYNYQMFLKDLDGTTHTLPEEGSFFQTENRYEAFVYYKGTGERSWRLVGFKETVFKAL